MRPKKEELWCISFMDSENTVVSYFFKWLMTYVHVGIHLKRLYFLQKKVVKFACLVFSTYYTTIILQVTHTKYLYFTFYGVEEENLKQLDSSIQEEKFYMHVYIIVLGMLQRQTMLTFTSSCIEQFLVLMCFHRYNQY